MSRLAKRFADLKAAGKKGFVSYISAGDPDLETSFSILQGLPGAGVLNVIAHRVRIITAPQVR